MSPAPCAVGQGAPGPGLCALLTRRAGPNDGLVPASSQRWGKVLREVRADHWAQVGWSIRFDAAALYEDILRELAALGF